MEPNDKAPANGVAAGVTAEPAKTHVLAMGKYDIGSYEFPLIKFSVPIKSVFS